MGLGFFDLNRRYESFDEKKESPLVRAVSRPWSRRRGCRRQDFVALPRGAGQRAGGRAVRFVLEGQGRSRQGERWFQALFAWREKEKREGRQERREPQVPPREACWTKKHERSYLNHIGVDRRRKFMRRYGTRACEPTN
jgi:hypothetical protein